MAGKNGTNINYSTADAMKIKEAFGPLLGAVNTGMEAAVKAFSDVADKPEPFDDGTPQKEAFRETVKKLKECADKITEKFNKSQATVTSCTEKFEAAMQKNANIAQQAATAVAQISAKAAEKGSN